jgi:hypothetical protein
MLSNKIGPNVEAVARMFAASRTYLIQPQEPALTMLRDPHEAALSAAGGEVAAESRAEASSEIVAWVLRLRLQRG